MATTSWAIYDTQTAQWWGGPNGWLVDAPDPTFPQCIGAPLVAAEAVNEFGTPDVMTLLKQQLLVVVG